MFCVESLITVEKYVVSMCSNNTRLYKISNNAKKCCAFFDSVIYSFSEI